MTEENPITPLIIGQTEGLNGSEMFMLISGSIVTFSALLGMTYSCILKSRCTSIKCCGLQCDRDVIDLTAEQTELGSVRSSFTPSSS